METIEPQQNNPPQSPLILRGDETAALSSRNRPQLKPPLKIRGGTRDISKAGELSRNQYLQTLVATGLEPDQAQIYEILLKNGPLKAGKVAQKSTLKRGLVYKILDELVNLGLVIKNEPTGKVAMFEPAHPLKIKAFAESKEQKIKTAQLALDGILGNLTSDYNLALNKPGMQFYEGIDGALKILNDSLNAKTEIYSYMDNETVNKYQPKINDEYVKKRNRLKVKKKIITMDSEYIRNRAKNYNKSTTDIRVIQAPVPFSTVMQIYDDKVSYIVIDKEKLISVLIQNLFISKMHKQLFEVMWLSAKPLAGPAPTAPSSAEIT
ncbi:MAG: hypothetical protein HYV13_02560 [Candidatus Doudnabacteria bacterium]|nr:hypothetical protein [Candidatus Doudnabacteria bacterium]